MKGEHLYEKIEAYLNGTLDPDALSSFEKELAENPALAKEVVLHRRMQSELGKPNKKLLRDNLKVISAKQTINITDEPAVTAPDRGSQKRLWWLLGALAILLVILAVLKMNKTTADTPTIPIEESQPEQQRLPTLESESTVPESLPQATNEVEENKTKEPAPLIASIDPKDFVPNPFLEEQIGAQVRGENYSVQMEEADMAEKIVLNGDVAALRLKGSLSSGDALPEGASFILSVYSNKKEDYMDDRSILNIPINLEALKDDAFPFQFNANLRITPGLYYYIIAEKEEDEPLYVGRFEVVPK